MARRPVSKELWRQLAAQLEQTNILLEDVGVKPKTVIVDLGFRGKIVEYHNPGIEIIHRGKFKQLTQEQRRWLRRRQAIEPAIGHLKADHGMDRCWLKGQMGDAIHAVLCAAGYNLRWLMRTVVRLGLKGFFARFFISAFLTWLACACQAMRCQQRQQDSKKLLMA